MNKFKGFCLFLTCIMVFQARADCWDSPKTKFYYSENKIIITFNFFISQDHYDRKLKVCVLGAGIAKELFTYEKIASFWVEEASGDKPARLILHYRRLFVPNIHIPIIGQNPEEVRQLMLNYGEEEKHVETFTEVIFESLGF